MTVSSRNQWVDERGVCHHPGCQNRGFLQRKAFSLYVRLSSTEKVSGGWPAVVAEAKQPRAACEHVLLHYQNTASAATGSEAGGHNDQW